MLRYPYYFHLYAWYLYKNFSDLEIIGNTIDDALGEAYDKTASLLGLGYPGGAVIEKFAGLFNPVPGEPNPLPKILSDRPDTDYNFSFSGIKTSVLRLVQIIRKTTPGSQDEDHFQKKICYYFQERCLELICRNVKKALTTFPLDTFIAGGGVTANQRLRSLIFSQLSYFNQKKINIYYPQNRQFSTDNAAMVACLGYFYFQSGIKSKGWIPIG